MNKKNKNEDKTNLREGYAPSKKGYNHDKSDPIGGHKPEKSEAKPINPPKEK